MARREVVAVFILGLVCAFVSTAHIFNNVHHWGIQDWDHHLMFMEVPRLTLLEYGQFPLWNPYSQGGMPMLGDPQSRFVSPFFLLHLIFGVVIGVKIEIALHLAVLLTGGYFLARRFVAPAAATVATAVYGLSTMFTWSLVVGMTWFLAVAYVPWVFFLATGNRDRAANRLAIAALLALMFFEGGAYVVVITGMALALWLLCVAHRRELIERLRYLLEIAVFAVGFGAIKIFPAVMFMRTYPRRADEYSGFSVSSLFSGLMDRAAFLVLAGDPGAEPGFWSGISYGVDENASYVGPVIGALLIVGILLAGRRHWRLLLCGGVFLWLSFGNRITPSLWDVLHLLPVFSAMRVAQRFRIIFLLFAALLAGLGLQALQDRLRSRARPRLVSAAAACVAFAVVADLLLTTLPLWQQAFPIEPLAVVREQDFAHVDDQHSYSVSGIRQSIDASSSWGAVFPAVLANLGVTDDGWGSVAIKGAALPRSSVRYRGEAYLQGASGSAGIHGWSPNRLEIVCVSANPDLLVVNQNYDSGWRAGGGQEVHAHEGLTAVPVGADQREVELFYRPASFVLGAIITALTLIAAVALQLWRRRNGPVAP